MEPLWTILIFYAFIVLTAIYTYQFDYIQDLWIDAFNSSHGDLSVDEMCVVCYTSVQSGITDPFKHLYRRGRRA